MVLNTVTVSAAVTPEIIGTTFSHYLNRKPLRHKPTAHISYDLGLHLVRRFVEYSALHTVEEVQEFTSQWVPAPTWVRVADVEISKGNLSAAAKHIQAQLGPDGLEQVGGREWWQWRRDNGPLKAEWIEMRSDYSARQAKGDKGSRILLYVHGGAYYFGSVDEHRYQMQRHARKLKARCLAPRYRLAPQFPFPCGLFDCLAAYLYLLENYEPSSILLAGDSAGGGMIVSLLVVLRDQGVPLPAGAILLSPWVDLMHSFPSIGRDGKLDYIPSHGFIHKPSVGWPPPTLEPDQKPMPSGVAAATGSNDSKADKDPSNHVPNRLGTKDEEQGFSVVSDTSAIPKPDPTAHSIPSIKIDGKLIKIRDQIQMYAPNHLLAHPLVSPVLQPSLGGLPPLLIQVGGGEMLRDEQIYLAHKAAHPTQYPPSDEVLDRHDPDRKQLHCHRPTDVQLQVWDDICHVGVTLSWTHPAKYMYRSVAQFGAWALARAQKRAIDIFDEEDLSDIESISLSDDAESPSPSEQKKPRTIKLADRPSLPNFAPLKAGASIGKAGDPLPPFKDYMIRQRVDRHGNIYELASPSLLPALQLRPSEIGVLKEAPVRKWLARQEEWNRKFARIKKQLQKQRAQQLEKGYVGIPEGEKPPPTALAGRRTEEMPRLEKIKKSWGMSLWSSWGSKHDQVTVERRETDLATGEGEGSEAKQDGNAGRTLAHGKQRSRSLSMKKSRSRPRSTSRTVTDEGQAGVEDRQHYGELLDPRNAPTITVDSSELIEETVIPLTNTTSTRPTHGGIAYPFKLQAPEDLMKSVNASMVTLNSADPGENNQSEGGNDPTPAMEGAVAESEADGTTAKPERPTVERFFTAVETL